MTAMYCLDCGHEFSVPDKSLRYDRGGPTISCPMCGGDVERVPDDDMDDDDFADYHVGFTKLG